METHTIIHAIIKNKKNKVLLIRRAPWVKIYPNMWSVPSGHIQKGETPEECLRREIKEELNTKIAKIIKKIDQYEMNLENRHWLVTLFIVEIEDPVKPNHEITEVRWVNKKDLAKFETTPMLDFHFKKAGLLT